MKTIVLFFILFILNVGAETESDAASYARYLVRHEYFGVFSSQLNESPNISIATAEDFAESCKMDGNLVFMLADVEIAAKNLYKNPYGSFSVAAPNCSANDFHGLPYDPLACIRFSLVGEFIRDDFPVNTSDPEFIAFQAKHPAAIDWIKYSGHTFRMWNMDIIKIDYVGGYGDLHYIGEISPDIYFGAKPVKPN